jgi:hypothetical protein
VRHLDRTTAVAIVLGVLAVRNAVGESLVLPVLYVPVNLATAALLALPGVVLPTRQVPRDHRAVRPAECADNRGELKEEMWIWTM